MRHFDTSEILRSVLGHHLALALRQFRLHLARLLDLLLSLLLLHEPRARIQLIALVRITKSFAFDFRVALAGFARLLRGFLALLAVDLLLSFGLESLPVVAGGGLSLVQCADVVFLAFAVVVVLLLELGSCAAAWHWQGRHAERHAHLVHLLDCSGVHDGRLLWCFGWVCVGGEKERWDKLDLAM